MADITTHPPLPAHVAETFEGMLLSRFADMEPISGGLMRVTSDEDFDTNDITMQQDEFDLFLARAKESTSDLAADLLPAVENFLSGRVERDEEVTIDELEAAAGRGISIEDVLHAICQRYPEEIPYLELEWSSAGKRMIHGSFCGGASVITPEGGQSMSTRSWLEQKRAELAPTLDAEAAFRP